ncbi:MAG: hypothetical protein AAB354_06245 [candidate division KSB1 bacterium]
MPASTATPYLFLLGRPAVGKSTVSKIISRVLKLPVENYFPIDKAHHLLCNPDVQSPHFYYTPQGTLIFRDRAAVMREALEWLAHAAQKRRVEAPNGFPLLFEFAHYDYASALEIFGAEVLRHSAIIEIVAPLTVARERNLARPAMDQVPEEWLQMAFAADVSCLAELVAPEKFVRLQNEHRLAQRELERRVREALRQFGLC